MFVEGDENASNGIKNISSKALIGDCINMPVIVQVLARSLQLTIILFLVYIVLSVRMSLFN